MTGVNNPARRFEIQRFNPAKTDILLDSDAVSSLVDNLLLCGRASTALESFLDQQITDDFGLMTSSTQTTRFAAALPG